MGSIREVKLAVFWPRSHYSRGSSVPRWLDRIRAIIVDNLEFLTGDVKPIRRAR